MSSMASWKSHFYRLRDLLGKYFMSTHSCAPRSITEAPWDGLILYQIIPSLLADSNTKNCQVSNLSHFKEKAQPWHEYVVATVVVNCALPGNPTLCGPQRGYLKIERTVRKEDLSTLTSSSSSSPANDLLSICTTDTMGFKNLDRRKLIESVDLPVPGFPLRELLVLLGVVTDARTGYLVWKFQCFWFSWVIMQAVIKYRSVTPTDGPAIHKRGRFGKSGGSFLRQDTKSLEEILKHFRERVNLSVAQVIVDQGNSGERSESSRLAAELEETRRDLDAERDRRRVIEEREADREAARQALEVAVQREREAAQREREAARQALEVAVQREREAARQALEVEKEKTRRAEAQAAASRQRFGHTE
jgi:hypothetical protein